MKKLIYLISIFILFSVQISAQTYNREDSVIFSNIIKTAQENNWNKLPINEIIINVGKQFLGKPYVAHTLEINDEEQLVINFRELDCTTFLETCLCFARTIQTNDLSLSNYKKQLETIRYRNEKLTNYCSRLHYFSDFIYEKGKIGIISDQTKEAKGIAFPIQVGFMSSHPDKYKMLNGKSDLINFMAKKEEEINKRSYFYIPKEDLNKSEKFIKSGDIIAITTNMNGLDISHVGYALWINDTLHFMHASSGAKKVVITDNSLQDYLMGIKHHTGIMLIRPLDNKQ